MSADTISSETGLILAICFTVVPVYSILGLTIFYLVLEKLLKIWDEHDKKNNLNNKKSS